MTDFRFVEKDTDLSILSEPYDWDVIINNRPYYVVKAAGFVHSYGGRWGDNDLWAYPRDEEPCYENLVPFDADTPVCWGVIYSPIIDTRHKYGERYAKNEKILQITRNGKIFCDKVSGGIAKAFDILDRIDNHPLNLNAIDFDKKAIGLKVCWGTDPATIVEYVDEQACVILEPDGVDHFTILDGFLNKYSKCQFSKKVKISIFDEYIKWYRE